MYLPKTTDYSSWAPGAANNEALRVEVMAQTAGQWCNLWRRWLIWLVLAGTAVIIGPKAAWGPYQYRHAIDDPLGRQKSQVYDVHGEYAVRGRKVHLASLRRMFDTGIKKLAGLHDVPAAWRCFIHDNDVVALKFSRPGNKLGTNQAVAAALLQCLYEAGFKPENFMLVGLDELPDEAVGTRPWRYGWQTQKVDFASSSDYLAQWLQEVTAIINVPSIMDDNITGLRCCLTNLSWPLLKSPARLYINHGDPFIPEIYELPQIRGKVRLHIANALRILYHGGPQVRETYIDEHGTLIFSVDPVALDRVALELIRRARRNLHLPAGANENISASYLETAYAMGLGYNDLNDFIDYHFLKHEKN